MMMKPGQNQQQRQQRQQRQQHQDAVPVISGIPALDQILDETNVARSISRAAGQLDEFVMKHHDDQQTVLQGLPAMLGALLGGGPQKNKYSWLSEHRSLQPSNIVSSTFVDIYVETPNDVLEGVLFRHGSPACQEYQKRGSGSAARSFSKRSLVCQHSTMLLFARLESRGRLARGSLFNAVFQPRVSMPCTFQFDANKLPASIRPAINAYLRGETVQMDRMPSLYQAILRRTEIALQNRFQAGHSRHLIAEKLELTPREFFLFSFFHYPVGNHLGRKRSLIGYGSSGGLRNAGVPSAFANRKITSDKTGQGNLGFGTVAQNVRASSVMSKFTGTSSAEARTSSTLKIYKHDYLAQAPLREIIHDDPYCMLVHQYCEFFMPFLNYSDDEDLFLQVLIQFWLRQGYRPIRNVGAITGFNHRSGVPMGLGGSAAFNVKPTSDQICALMVFLTHVLVRDSADLRYPGSKDGHNRLSMPVTPQITADGYNYGMSPTLDLLARPLYDFFWQALNEASHGSLKPILSNAVDLWLAYIQPWRAHNRAGLPPRKYRQQRGQLGQDFRSVNATRMRNEAHNTRGIDGASRKTAAALRVREADIGAEWVGFIVQNYCFYIEMLTIVVDRIHRNNFNLVNQDSGDLLLLERIFAVYTPNVRSILQECQMYLEIYNFAGSVAGPERRRLERATVWLNQKRDADELFVSFELAKLLKGHYHKIEPDLDPENMPNIGSDLIQYLDKELNRKSDHSWMNKSWGARLKSMYSGLGGVFKFSEPHRDPAGFITKQGRQDIVQKNNFSSAAHWNSEYGPQGISHAPCSFMREIYGKDQTVIRLIPKDPMLRPVRRDEVRLLVWLLVPISRWINKYFGWHYRWLEYVKVDCREDQLWLPIYPEQQLIHLKEQIMRKLVKLQKVEKGQSLDTLVLLYNNSELTTLDDRLCDLDIHHDSKIHVRIISTTAPTTEGKASTLEAEDMAMKLPKTESESQIEKQKDSRSGDDDGKMNEVSASEDTLIIPDRTSSQFINDPWLEEMPAGTFGASRSGNCETNLMTVSRKLNLNADIRINRLQRMIHLLFEVPGDPPLAISSQRNVNSAKNAVTEDEQKSKEKTSKDEAISSSNTSLRRRGIKTPQWESGTLPFFGRINLRPLASLEGIIYALLFIMVLWYCFTPESTKEMSKGVTIVH